MRYVFSLYDLVDNKYLTIVGITNAEEACICQTPGPLFGKEIAYYEREFYWCEQGATEMGPDYRYKVLSAKQQD